MWPRSVSRPGTDGCPTPRVHQSQPLLASSRQRLPKMPFKPRHCASPRYHRRVEACRGGPHHRVWSALLSEELSPWSRTQRSERPPFPFENARTEQTHHPESQLLGSRYRMLQGLSTRYPGVPQQHSSQHSPEERPAQGEVMISTTKLLGKSSDCTFVNVLSLINLRRQY